MERLPKNELVELYENRIGVTFEVAPSFNVASTVMMAPNGFQVFCNFVLFVIVLVIVGKFLVSHVAQRSVQRRLVNHLPESEKHKPENTAEPPTDR